MRIPQLSVFLENQPGHLIVPCRLLADAGINVVTLSLADTQQFGILRLIVREWQRARAVVELLGLFEQAGINVEYMDAFTARLGNRAVLVFRFDDLDAAITALTRAGINPVSPINLYDHLEEE